jgi:REP element-mobilizing transposase RayT
MMEKFPKLKQHLWLGKLWARRYYVGTSGDKVTADEIKKYIRYYQHHTEQLELFAKESKNSTNNPPPLGGGC